MPRIKFGKLGDLIGWIGSKVDANKYESYVTDRKEIILAPTKSTPPITFGYFRATSPEDLKSALQTIKAKGIEMYRCEEYEWKTDSPIGSVYHNGD